MSVTALVMNGLAVTGLIVAGIVNRRKALQALKAAWHAFIGMAPRVLIIVILIGIILGFIPREFIARVVGGESGFRGILLSATFGAIMFIPSILAFPLAGSLLESGAALSSVAAFITSLTMIGIVSLPVELKVLGKKMTLYRNVFGFIFALMIAMVMGALL
ncbi:MAG: permease [Spirochaetales bacterium]|nr:permease [Spirochaetales bacterium]